MGKAFCRVLYGTLFLCGTCFSIAQEVHSADNVTQSLRQSLPFKSQDGVLMPDSDGNIAKDRVQIPKVIHAVDPKYPHSSKLSGVCGLSALIDLSGKAQQIHVIRPLAPEYDENAIKAVQKFRFRPATLDGKPAIFKISVELNFVH